MSSNTKTLKLLMMDPVTDGDQNFNIQTMLNDNWNKIDSMATATAGYYRIFEPEEWTGASGAPKELRIAQTEHGMSPDSTSVVCTLRHRVGRNTRDYDDEDSIVTVRAAILAAQTAALAANTATAGTFPVVEDGHAILTWETMQVWLLEDTLLAADAAAARAAERHVNWKDRDTLGVEATVTLDQLMTAAYLPALGGPSTEFDALCNSIEVVQGLRFRRVERGMDVDDFDYYDMNGEFVANTWGAMESKVAWDLETGELVVRSGSAFAGDIKVLR